MRAGAPAAGDLGRRSPPAAWEAAFLIGVFPGEGDLRWVKVQLFSGRSRDARGYCLSAVEGMDGPGAAVVAAGRRQGVDVHEAALGAGELVLAPGGWDVAAPGVAWAGEWPRTSLTLAEPAVAATTESRDVLWWSRIPRVLSYWGAFGPLDWGGVTGVGVVERAWGAAVPFDVARAPFRWHWDVLAFGDGSACAGLAVDARLGLGLRGLRSGGSVPGEEFAVGRGVRVEVTAWGREAAGRVPLRWRGRLRLRGGVVVYEARASTAVARLVPGGGFSGFDFEGEWRPRGGPARGVSGTGFTEYRAQLWVQFRRHVAGIAPTGAQEPPPVALAGPWPGERWRNRMGPRVTIIGGGSYHWVPSVVSDMAATPSLQDAEIVLEDVDASRLPRMAELVAHLARVRGIGLRASTTTAQRAALEGADYVVFATSTGGFASMAHDVEIPERHGLRQPLGDSVGPGGVMRALRATPVILDLARDMAEVCPDAWLVNVSNPLSALCRAVTRETSVRTVGLCNELLGTQFALCLLFGVEMGAVDPVVGGVNHLPLVTGLSVDGGDGFAMLAQLMGDDERAAEPVWVDPPPAMEYEKVSPGGQWTKADVLHNNRLKLELFGRFGILPGSADHHVAEFFPYFVTEESGWGRDWGVELWGIGKQEAEQAAERARLEAMLAAAEPWPLPSGELVAPLVDGLAGGGTRLLPVNVPNAGHVADLPDGAVVEVVATVDGDGVRGRDSVEVGGVLGEWLRRVAASQEFTVAAALAGDPTLVLEAMLCDPLVGRLPYESVTAMTDEMLAATAPWLPQFAAPAPGRVGRRL